MKHDKYGDCGEGVNAPDCGSGIRGFKSHQSPHDKTISSDIGGFLFASNYSYISGVRIRYRISESLKQYEFTQSN